MELLEFEEDGENNAPIDIEDDDNYDDTDPFCKEVDEEDCDLCSGFVENRFAYVFQPCGHMICTSCAKKSYCH